MVRLFDRSFEDKQNVCSMLSLVFGLNRSSAIRICGVIGISSNEKLLSIPRNKLKKLEFFVSNKFLVGRPLKRIYISNIDQKIKKGTYVGLRIRQGLPSRGQRTHTNAKSVKRVGIVKVIS
jgi:small subunit ribosomal protein S13